MEKIRSIFAYLKRRKRVRRQARRLATLYFDVAPLGSFAVPTPAQRRWYRKHFYAHRRSLVAALLVVTVLTTSIFGYQLVTKAEVATYYPEVCLGGWTQPNNATGKPDADDGLTKNNAAVLEDAQAQLFCSQFSGAPLEERVNQKVLVRFSWGTEGSVPDTHEKPTTTIIPDIDPASAIEQILNLPSGENAELIIPVSEPVQEPEVPEVTPEESQSSTAPIESTETQPAEESSPPQVSQPQPAAEPAEPAPTAPQSFLHMIKKAITYTFRPPVFAQEVSEQQPPVESPEPPVEAVTAPVPEPVPELAPELAVPQAPSPSEDTEESVQPAPTIPDEQLLEVLYTLDGTTWKTLGTVSSLTEKSAFEIPLSDVAVPDDVSRLQVAVHALPILGDRPALFIDSMWIEVTHGKPGEDPYPPPNPALGDVFVMEASFDDDVAVLVERPAETGTTTELWLRDNTPTIPNWTRIAGDELIGDQQAIGFVHGNVFWIGEGGQTIWRFSPASAGYDSVSVSAGAEPVLRFRSETGEDKEIQLSDVWLVLNGVRPEPPAADALPDIPVIDVDTNELIQEQATSTSSDAADAP